MSLPAASAEPNPPRTSAAPFDAVNAGEISLAEIADTLLSRKWLIVLATLVCTAAAAIAALTITPIYRAEVLISPAKESDAKGGLGALAGQLGGLASLAGVNLGGGGNKGEALATLASRALTENYIGQQNLLPELFSNRWNAQARRFEPDSKGKIPTLWDGNKLFNKKIRTITEDRKSGMITLGIQWKDPKLAAAWANDMVKLTNATLRDRAIAESNRNLSYLNAQLEKTSVVELRQAIYRLIETEVKSVMIAEGSQEYAFKVIDPAVIPQDKIKPQRGLMVFSGFFLGFLFSCLYALIRKAPTSQNL